MKIKEFILCCCIVRFPGYNLLLFLNSRPASSAGPVASWEGHAQSGEGLRNLIKKNGAGVTSANEFIHNLGYKQAIRKGREIGDSKDVEGSIF